MQGVHEVCVHVYVLVLLVWYNVHSRLYKTAVVHEISFVVDPSIKIIVDWYL